MGYARTLGCRYTGGILGRWQQRRPQRGRTPSEQMFASMRVLGKGSFGKVVLVQKRTGKERGGLFAMKILRKTHLVKRRQIERTKTERKVLVLGRSSVHYEATLRLPVGGQVIPRPGLLSRGRTFLPSVQISTIPGTSRALLRGRTSARPWPFAQEGHHIPRLQTGECSPRRRRSRQAGRFRSRQG